MDLEDLYDDRGNLLAKAEQKLDEYLNVHHHQFHKTLLWASVAIILNFLFIVIRLHSLANTEDERKVYLTALFVFITVSLSLSLFAIWKAATLLGPADWEPGKVLLQYKIDVMDKQAKMLGVYLLSYTFALVSAYIFYELTDIIESKKVLESTSSVSIMMYGLGAYSLKICLSRRYKLVRERDEWPSDLEKAYQNGRGKN